MFCYMMIYRPVAIFALQNANFYIYSHLYSFKQLVYEEVLFKNEESRHRFIPLKSFIIKIRQDDDGNFSPSISAQQ